MRSCPNCGNVLHNDSTFCFACMSVLNERNDIPFEVPNRGKKAVIAACLATAAVAASTLFFVANDKNSAIETKAPEAPTPAATSAVVTTTPQTTTTTTSQTTTTAPNRPTADDIDKIAGGIKNAVTGSATMTTTTTTEPVTEPPEDVQQEEVTDDSVAEPTYYSADGASDMTLYYLDYINNIRESNGFKPFRACGQLDKAVLDSLHAEEDTPTLIQGELTSDPYSQLSAVGLPTNSEIKFVCGYAFHYDDDEDPLPKCLEALHQDFPNDNFNDNDLAHGMNDYTYLSVVYYPDPLLDKGARETSNEWWPYEGQQYGIRIYAMK